MFEYLTEQQKIDLVAIFWAYVEKKGPLPDPKTGVKTRCWVWEGYVRIDGALRFSFGGTRYSPRRVSYAVRNGQLEDDLIVSVNCDNPLCVRHLIARTRATLRADQNRVENRTHKAKLTPADVRAIRQLAAEGIKVIYLVDAFKVSGSTIRNVVSRKLWTDIK